jgi:hypothetical protein
MQLKKLLHEQILHIQGLNTQTRSDVTPQMYSKKKRGSEDGEVKGQGGGKEGKRWSWRSSRREGGGGGGGGTESGA